MPDASPPERRQLTRLLTNRAVMAATAASLITGFAQFTAVVALGDVAAAFGERDPQDATLAGAAGLSFTALGAGLATIRLASLVGLPLAAAADRLGRRRTLLVLLGVGLTLTAAAAGSQSFWWFVAALALARPGLSAVNALAGVVAAEETDARDRSAAMGAVTVGYGIGSGSVTVVRAVLADVIGFRSLFLLALVLLVVGLPLLWRVVPEPARFARWQRTGTSLLGPSPVPPPGGAPAGSAPPAGGLIGALPAYRPGLLAPWRPPLRRNLGVLAATTLAVAFVAGPATGLLFVYGENVLEVEPVVVGAAVAGAAPLGAIGLVIGRYGADRLGRRGTAAAAQIGLAVAAAVTYSGSVPALVGGYLAVLFASSAYAPPTGALAAELFPTRVRATAAGWLTVAGVVGAVSGLMAFGLASDATDSAGGGAITVALPAALVTAAFALIPETRGRELED